MCQMVRFTKLKNGCRPIRAGCACGQCRPGRTYRAALVILNPRYVEVIKPNYAGYMRVKGTATGYDYGWQVVKNKMAIAIQDFKATPHRFISVDEDGKPLGESMSAELKEISDCLDEVFIQADKLNVLLKPFENRINAIAKRPLAEMNTQDRIQVAALLTMRPTKAS